MNIAEYNIVNLIIQPTPHLLPYLFPPFPKNAIDIKEMKQSFGTAPFYFLLLIY